MKAKFLPCSVVMLLALQGCGVDDATALDSRAGVQGIGLTIVLPTPNITSEFLVANGLVLAIRNDTDRDYFARLGDGFNASADQSPLFLASGTSARLERLTANQWVEVQLGTLVEGSRVVALRARRTYALRAALTSALTPGTYRVVVGYAESASAAEGSAQATVFSPQFSIPQ